VIRNAFGVEVTATAHRIRQIAQVIVIIIGIIALLKYLAVF